jgi:hypothetical protein
LTGSWLLGHATDEEKGQGYVDNGQMLPSPWFWLHIVENPPKRFLIFSADEQINMEICQEILRHYMVPSMYLFFRRRERFNAAST